MLPSAVRYRETKAEFSKVFTETFNQHGSKTLFDCLEIADQGWVDVVAAREAYQRLCSEGQAMYHPYIWRLWHVYGLELWYRALTSKGALLAQAKA